MSSKESTTSAGDAGCICITTNSRRLPLLLLLLLLVQIHAKSTKHHQWLVMLDVAAYVPTHALNLSRTPADFVSLSFYKVFGYPAGMHLVYNCMPNRKAILNSVLYALLTLESALYASQM
jgi:hypothetical protein